MIRNNHNASRAVVQWSALLLFIWEVPGSIPAAGHLGEVFCGFPPHLWVNTGVVALEVGHNRIPFSLLYLTVHLQFTSQFTLTELANDLSR